jgi:SNF2 family DNA or RNA helicase
VPFADLDGDTIAVTTEFHERHLMQQVPGARYNRKTERWEAPASWATCIALRGLYADRLVGSEALASWSWDTYHKRISPALKTRDQLALPGPFAELDDLETDQLYKLYPYQCVDSFILLTNQRALLANPPGLGKTGVIIRTLQLLQRRGAQPFPALIVCPNSLKLSTWQGELLTWAPELSVVVVDGGAAKRRQQLETPADIYVMNYESVRLHTRIAGFGSIALGEKDRQLKELNGMGLRTVVADEAHRLKNPQAIQTRAVWAVMHGAEYRFVMTGTPVTSNIGDLWALLHAIEPTWFPSRTKYLERYAETSMNYPYGSQVIHGVNPQHRDEFFELLNPLMRRVPKEAALPYLPPKLPVQIRHTPMSPKQKRAYGQMEKYMIAQLNELLVAPTTLAVLGRLAQFAAASAEITEDGKLRLTAPSTKVDDMVDLLEEMGEEPLVVAAVSRQLIELCSARLEKLKIPHGLVTGEQSVVERQQAVQRFQEGKLRVILLTLGAGAEGITLTRANTLLFLQESWSEVQNQQAQDRIYRIGSERHDVIRIIKQVTPDSIEEHRMEILEGKRLRMEEIVRDRQTLLKLLGVS